MALQLVKEVRDSGITANYWKITNIGFNIKIGIVEVHVSLYKDEQARVDNKQPIDAKSYSWRGEDNPLTVQALEAAGVTPQSLCYDKLKTLEELSGAVDV